LGERRELVSGRAEDHREHLLVYLFAMLLPFYATRIDSWRDGAAVLVALSFIVFLFWHLNLHYMNLIFAARGFRVFTLYPPPTQTRPSGKDSYVVITRRVTLAPGERVNAYRVSDTVYIEENE